MYLAHQIKQNVFAAIPAIWKKQKMCSVGRTPMCVTSLEGQRCVLTVHDESNKLHARFLKQSPLCNVPHRVQKWIVCSL